MKKIFKDKVMQEHYETLVVKDGLDTKSAAKEVRGLYNLKVYDCVLTKKAGGSFSFVIVARNKERAMDFAKQYKLHYGYSKISELKYRGKNNKPMFDLPDKEGAY